MACMGEKQAAEHFAEVYCNLLDKHRERLGFYLADDAVLDWFGRTVSGKESIAGFINLEVPETQHCLTSILPSDPIQHRKRSYVEPMDDSVMSSKDQKHLDDSLSDDELAKPLVNTDFITSSTKDIVSEINLNRLSLERTGLESTFESVESWESRFTTPMNCEIPTASENYNKFEEGQGDCFPKASISTSAKANRFLEARGSIQFLRTKQPKMAPKNMKLLSDTMKWGRHFKLQIAYTGPNTGFHQDRGDGFTEDFKIWLLVYQDNTSCRRNLSNDFDRVTGKATETG
ncbi:uncharacterized protein [Periplaneta americana]|uniref:uncharacterized protein n=1 Tax=Periplaneta americana TaxID=6978 RepID=UPI0037E8BF0D